MLSFFEAIMYNFALPRTEEVETSGFVCVGTLDGPLSLWAAGADHFFLIRWSILKKNYDVWIIGINTNFSS